MYMISELMIILPPALMTFFQKKNPFLLLDLLKKYFQNNESYYIYIHIYAYRVRE